MQSTSKEDAKETKQINALDALAKIGVCPQSYEWQRGYYENDICGKCKRNVCNGYRCAGGTHYVCMGCVNQSA